MNASTAQITTLEMTAIMEVDKKFTSVQLYDSLRLFPGSETIRVLDLDASSGNAKAQLTGTLKVLDLKQSPEYAALSYVWGLRSTTRQVVVCNGCEIEITANCHAALTSLRSLHGRITIWVDSFCINQSDDEEKAQQIQLMGQIYMFARPTYVWLGKGTQSTDRAMKCIAGSSRLRFVPVHIPWVSSDGALIAHLDRLRALKQLWRLWWFTSFTFRKRSHPYLKYCKELEDVSSLLEKPWVSRMWTFQEIVLASAPIIVCGSKSCEWSKFSQGIDILFDGEPAIWNFLPIPMAANAINMSLELSNIGQWVDLIRFWNKLPRPASWNGVKFRPTIDGETWTADVYHARLIRSTLKVALKLSTCIYVLGLITLGLTVFTFIPVGAYVMTEPKAVKFLYGNLFGLLGMCIIMMIYSVVGISDLHERSDLGRLKRTSNGSCPDYLAINPSLLAQTIRVLQSRDASDPKDKAFALYGVLKALNIVTPAPDYSKSLSQVYEELCTSLITNNPLCINLILLAGHAQDTLPSWVPKWDSVGRMTWLDPSFFHSMLHYYPLSSSSMVRIDQGRLIVRCIWSGTVLLKMAELPLLTEVDDDLTNSDASEDECVFLIGLCRWFNKAGIGRHHVSNTRNILLADGLRFGDHGLQEQDLLFETYEEWFQAICDGLLRRTLGEQEGQGGEEAAAEPRGEAADSLSKNNVTQFLEGNRSVRAFSRKLSQRIGERRCLIYSREGGLGTASINVKEGDRLAAIMGLATPVVLRASRESEASTCSSNSEPEPTLGDNTGVAIRATETYRVVCPAITEKLVRWQWTKTRYFFMGGALNMTALLVALKDDELNLIVPEVYKDLERFEEVVLV